MAITATHLADTIATPTATLSVTPATVGNCLMVSVATFVNPATATPALPSGGGVATWEPAGSSSDGSTYTVSFFLGRVTTAGAATLTLNYGGTIGANQTEVAVWELTDGAAREWAVVAAAASPVSGSTTAVTYPTLVAATTSASQFYFGFGGYGSNGVAATTGAFTQTLNTDATGNCIETGQVVSGSSNTPAATEDAAVGWHTHGVIVCGFNVRKPGLRTLQAVKRAAVR